MIQLVAALQNTEITPENEAAKRETMIQLVTDSVTSEHTKRAYGRALADFFAWHEAQGRPPLNKALVQRYAVYLADEQGMTPQTVNQRLSAIRKLASEAADNGILPDQLANGIKNVRGIRQEGTRTGNWLTKEKVKAVLAKPDITTKKGRRDRALLAVMFGAGLRRDEVARLTWEHVQQREGRWVLLDIVGKRNKTRTVPIPPWSKVALNAWAGDVQAAGRTLEGRIFLPINKGGRITGDCMTAQSVYVAVHRYTDIEPHDLRRTYAKLAHQGGAPIEQIQLSLGHASIQTTERYLGIEQDLANAPCDYLGLSL